MYKNIIILILSILLVWSLQYHYADKGNFTKKVNSDVVKPQKSSPIKEINQIIKSDQGYTIKENVGYSVIANSGKEVHLIDDSEYGDMMQSHYFIEVIKDKYAIFHNVGWEWGKFIIINLESGRMLSLNDYPIFSSDLTKVISLDANERDGSSIELYELANNDFQLLFKKGHEEYYLPDFHSWINNNEIRIEDTRWIKDENAKFGQRLGIKNMILSYNEILKEWEYKETTEKFSKEEKISPIDRSQFQKKQKLKISDLKNAYEKKLK